MRAFLTGRLFGVCFLKPKWIFFWKWSQVSIFSEAGVSNALKFSMNNRFFWEHFKENQSFSICLYRVVICIHRFRTQQPDPQMSFLLCLLYPCMGTADKCFGHLYLYEEIKSPYLVWCLCMTNILSRIVPSMLGFYASPFVPSLTNPRPPMSERKQPDQQYMLLMVQVVKKLFLCCSFWAVFLGEILNTILSISYAPNSYLHCKVCFLYDIFHWTKFSMSHRNVTWSSIPSVHLCLVFIQVQ